MNFFDKLRGDQMPIPPRPRGKTIALASLACALTAGFLALASLYGHAILLMAPLGASCFLVMALTMWARVPHPPAGANAIVIFMTLPDWGFLLFPTLAGSVLVILLGLIFLNLTRPLRYPKYW